MFGQPAFQTTPSRLDALMQNLRDLESKVRRLDPRDVKRASADIVDSVGSALEDIADRFRDGAGYTTREAGRIGQRASAAGRDSYEFLEGRN